jgi:hypothetical protein
MAPPKVEEIPSYMINAYTMNGTTPIHSWYIDESREQTCHIWTNELISEFIEDFAYDKIKSGTNKYQNYINAPRFIMDACIKYETDIRGKNIAVIGSHYPWIEAILINGGAKSVTTVEYNVPVCNHDIIKTISYDAFCKSDEKYDAVFSYSSIEHSGLGRYGDDLNPNGDIEAMMYIHKLLQPNGLCFLGIPVGTDAVVWNAHRIYGKNRLPMISSYKFSEIEWIGHDRDILNTCKPDDMNALCSNIQPLIVLRKL